MNLTSQNVHKVLKDCLYMNHEVIDGKPIIPPVEVEGIVRKFGFNPVRLERHKEEIRQMLEELPDTFKIGSGGGMSFLNACMTKDGIQWGEHIDIEALFALGIGIKYARYLFARDMWAGLPGGVPYIQVGELPEGQCEGHVL